MAGLLGVSLTVGSSAQADNGKKGDASAEPLTAGGGGQVGSSQSAKPKPSADPSPEASSDALTAGGGSLPGVKPQADTEPAPEFIDPGDAQPPIDPNFVDNYGRLWKQVEADKRRAARLSVTLAAARSNVAASASDVAQVIREQGRADAELAGATSSLDGSIRDLYITGTTDVDVLLGVMGSKPEDVLNNIDSFVYLRSATGAESDDFVAAQQASVITQSAAAQAIIRQDGDRDRMAEILASLTTTKKRLKKDQDELQRLVAAAAPQTVVGKDGCPTSVAPGTVPEGINIKKLCANAVKHAPTAQAAIAIKWALLRLGAPYACDGIGRLEPWRYDCSSYVSRAYAEGAGLKTAGDTWAPSTRNMVPWDGVPLDQHYAPIPSDMRRPGDLVLYDTCPAGQTCSYRHVAMYLGPMKKGGLPVMAHTNGCGLVAHVSPFTGTEVANFLGARRVVALAGEKIHQLFATPKKPGDKLAAKPAKKPAKKPANADKPAKKPAKKPAAQS